MLTFFILAVVIMFFWGTFEAIFVKDDPDERYRLKEQTYQNTHTKL